MKFSKYHGCGNDFIIIRYEQNLDYENIAIQVCNRNIGIGADGLIVVKENPLEMIFYNADGSRGTMCGNGIRCFAKYCYDEQLVNEKQFSVKTLAGDMNINLFDEDIFWVRVDLGKPSFNNEYTKIDSDVIPFFNQELLTTKGVIPVDSLFMGTVHTVVWVSTLEAALDTSLADEICNYPLFKDRTNVNFVKVVNSENFVIRTYERGVGWTKACGTGAAASFVVGKIKGKCKEKIMVHLEYGMLEISEENDHIIMNGPAKMIAKGEIEKNWL